MTRRPYTIGIITGSGPEAGMDLWSKVLVATQTQLGQAFRGDLDAPRVVILSEPELGLSMDLRRNEVATWEALERSVRQIAPQVDVFAIACNTLNWFAPRVERLLLSLPDAGVLLSFQAVLKTAIKASGASRVGLMAAGPVLALDEYSVYTSLCSDVQFEVSRQTTQLHALIEDVKRLGHASDGLAQRFETMTQDLASSTVVLACTELPLIAVPVEGKTFIDVTECVAETLAARAINARKNDL